MKFLLLLDNCGTLSGNIIVIITNIIQNTFRFAVGIAGATSGPSKNDFCGVLSIPPSSALSENAFSYCENTISKKRMRFSASTVESLVVVICIWQ